MRFDCASSGFRMPAEWEPMAATWLGWPVYENREDLWGEYYGQVCAEFALVAQTIARFQRCFVTAHFSCVENAKKMCGPQVTVVGVSAEDNWNRDCGPIFLINEKTQTQVGAIFKFNSWGEKYTPYVGQQQLGEEICAFSDVKTVYSEMVLEGGGFFVDGQGTLLTTESCLLNPNRNPHMSRREIENELKRMLGVGKIIWLPGSEIEVETNGHIDGIASFCAPGKILFNAALPKDGAEYFKETKENRRALELATDVAGRSFELIDLPVPSVTNRLGDDPERHCDIYSNYILVNGAVISVRFDVAEDEIARDVFARAYPGREVILLPVRHIGMGGGSIHCSSQQQPLVGRCLSVQL